MKDNRKDVLRAIEQEILSISYPKHVASLYEPVSYILSLGGKRIRPTFLLLACDAFCGDYSRAMAPAVGLEMFHNFTLLHDDIMDNSEVRRGKPVAHKVWGVNGAILSGDAMQILAYQWLMKVEARIQEEVLRLFSQTALEVMEGQQLDLEFEGRETVGSEEYLDMIRMKTAVLVGESLRIGALVGGADGQEADALYRFGESVGLAFQLRDDYLDVFGNSDLFGKAIGNDIVSNKKTFLLIQALERSNEEQKRELTGWLTRKDVDPQEKIAAVTALYRQLEVDSISMDLADELYRNGVAQLLKLPNGEERFAVILSLADELMEREK